MALEKTRNLSHLHPLEIMRSEPLGSYLVYTTWVRLYVGNIMRPSIMFVTLFFVFPLGSFLIIIIQRRSRSYVAIGFSTSCSKNIKVILNYWVLESYIGKMMKLLYLLNITKQRLRSTLPALHPHFLIFIKKDQDQLYFIYSYWIF